MSQYDISEHSPAQVLAETFNQARVNGYVSESEGHFNTFSNASLRDHGFSPCPDELRTEELSVETAQMILDEARRVQGTEHPSIEGINGRWLRLSFDFPQAVLTAHHQIIGDDIEGAEQYSADHGVSIDQILSDLKGQ